MLAVLSEKATVSRPGDAVFAGSSTLEMNEAGLESPGLSVVGTPKPSMDGSGVRTVGWLVGTLDGELVGHDVSHGLGGFGHCGIEQEQAQTHSGWLPFSIPFTFSSVVKNGALLLTAVPRSATIELKSPKKIKATKQFIIRASYFIASLANGYEYSHTGRAKTK